MMGGLNLFYCLVINKHIALSSGLKKLALLLTVCAVILLKGGIATLEKSSRTNFCNGLVYLTTVCMFLLNPSQDDKVPVNLCT